MTDRIETVVNAVDMSLPSMTANDSIGGLEVAAGERTGMTGVSMDEGRIQQKGGPKGIEAAGCLDPGHLLRQ